MTRNLHRITRLAAVLSAFAVGFGVADAAVAASGSAGLARGILITQFGFSPARADSWTTGACSYRERPASCYQAPSQARADSLAQARSFGVYRGLTRQQAHDWSVGVCSYADKPSSCYLSHSQAVAQSKALANAMGVPALPSGPAAAPSSGGFSWGDAGIGAGATLGVVLLAVGLGFTTARGRLRPLRQA